MKMSSSKNFNYKNHREDLADDIITKSFAIKQKVNIEKSSDIIGIFFSNSLVRIAFTIMLLVSFAAGFGSASNDYDSDSDQIAVFEEIYYKNSEIL